MARLTISAVGDISFAGRLGELILERGPAFPFEHVLGSLRRADVRFGSLESVMNPDGFPLEKTIEGALQSRDHVWASLQAVGFDVVNQATNHVLDCGWRGLLHTRERICAAGALPLGVGADQEEARTMQVVEREGMRIGFLGYLEPCNWTLEGGAGRIAYFKLPDVLEDIRAHRAEVDLLVVSLHADLEFRMAPSIPRVEACRQVAEAGADLILCHHPHVPQGVERWGESLIAYSLGNFVFDVSRYQESGSPRVFSAHILFVDIEDSKIVGWRREHFRIHEEERRPSPLSASGAAEAEAYCASLDDILTDPERTRELWYETCRCYFRGAWTRLTEGGPDKFIENYGWRVLGNAESLNWVRGIQELAQIEYGKNSRHDFEFTRPNQPFED